MKKLRIGILDFYNIQEIQRMQQVLQMTRDSSQKKKPKAFSLLAQAIRNAGHTPVIYHPEHCQMLFDHSSASIFYKGKKIKGCDVLIPRINITSNVELEISLVKQFQRMDIPVINDYLSILKSLNKLLTLQELSKARIPIPKTIIVRKFEYLDKAIEMLGGYPVVVKSVFGAYGKQVALIESRRSLISTLDILWKYNSTAVLLIQEYIEEAQGMDYRAFVVNNQVVASIQRTAHLEDFRSNVNLGGSAKPIELDENEKNIALNAAQALGLKVCSVDFLRTKKGPIIIELNPSAGVIGMMKTTSIDVPAKIVDYALSVVKNFPK